MDAAKIATFSASLSRCLADPGFLDRFYELFRGSSPEIARRFENTDFERQKRALSSSLYVMVMAVEGGDAALAYLERIAERHSRRELDIPPALYDDWLECLIEAARGCDGEFSRATENLWREAMRYGIELMRSRY